MDFREMALLGGDIPLPPPLGLVQARALGQGQVPLGLAEQRPRRHSRPNYSRSAMPTTRASSFPRSRQTGRSSSPALGTRTSSFGGFGIRGMSRARRRRWGRRRREVREVFWGSGELGKYSVVRWFCRNVYLGPFSAGWEGWLPCQMFCRVVRVDFILVRCVRGMERG